MELASLVKSQCQSQSRESFLARHPHPWLIRQLTEEELVTAGSRSFQHDTGATYPTTSLQMRPYVSVRRLAARLFRECHRYGVVPVVKSGSNPWRSRILIGRAGNNDVVLPDPSVSKLHAHLVQVGAEWTLQDVDSVNGTLVDGKALRSGREGARLRSGAMLQFGGVACEFIASGELYEILVAPDACSYPGLT
jgi:hypothetical protein